MPELDGPDAPADIDLGGGVAFLHTPSIPSRGGLALTHGAGGNCETPLLQRIASWLRHEGPTDGVAPCIHAMPMSAHTAASRISGRSQDAPITPP